MAVSPSIIDREYDKFIDSAGDTALRLVLTTTAGTSSPLGRSVNTLENGKFVEDINGDVAVVFLAV